METEKRTPWYEMLNGEIASRGYIIHALEVVREGALITIQENENCIGPWMYVASEPVDISKIPEIGWLSAIMTIDNLSLPTFTGYHDCYFRDYQEEIRSSQEERIRLIDDYKEFLERFIEFKRYSPTS